MDIGINRSGLAERRRAAHDRPMSESIRQAALAEIGKHRSWFETGIPVVIDLKETRS